MEPYHHIVNRVIDNYDRFLTNNNHRMNIHFFCNQNRKVVDELPYECLEQHYDSNEDENLL